VKLSNNTAFLVEVEVFGGEVSAGGDGADAAGAVVVKRGGDGGAAQPLVREAAARAEEELEATAGERSDADGL